MMTVSIDFETANYSRTSVCAAGLAIFDGSKLTESPYWLVRPPKGYGWFLQEFTDNCHGLTWFDVRWSPEFPAIAPSFFERLSCADIVIAHNAQFDLGALQAITEHFGLACPPFEYLCTYRVAKRLWPELPNHKLNTLAAHIGHEFQHHNAQSDAEAAGRVMLALMKNVQAQNPSQLLSKANMAASRFTPLPCGGVQVSEP
ncbi:putative Exonuclease [Verrucomicrobia bacterium]|nr:putative Exonuclease [Verrucomicrobiota bacterium]